MRIVVFAIIFSYVNVSFAQDRLFFTQKTESFTNCILKDSDGFVWVGTQDGLLRYDYTKFKSFRHQANDKFSLPNNWIWSLVEDKHENLWIGTFGGGLAMWDKNSEKFYSFPNNIDINAESIHSLALYKDSFLLVGTEAGPFQFDILRHVFSPIVIMEESNDILVNDIYASPDGDIYIGTNEALYAKDISENSYRALEIFSEPTIINEITGIAHRIYIGTDKGLFIYNRRKRTIDHQLKDFDVQYILPLNTDQWYLGTDSGIGYYNSGEGYKWYSSKTGGESNLKSDFVHTIFEIDQELLWAGTRKGVHQFSIKPPDFLNLNDVYSNTSCSSTALGMAEDFENNLWICSRNGLLYVTLNSDLTVSKSKCFMPESQPGMNDAYTINVTSTLDGSLWLAYRKNGFSKIIKENGKWKWENFAEINALLEGEGVNQVFQDSDGEMWLASRGKGLIKFDPQTQKTQVYGVADGLSHPYVFRIFEDNAGYFWLSTANGGVCKFDKKNNLFICSALDRNNPSSLSANMVLSTNQYSDDRAIVSTVNGLNIKQSDSTFLHINTFDGLPDNIIYGALEDDNGFLWVSTNEGISRIKMKGEKIQTTNYSKAQGLASTEYNQHSFLEHSSGLFFFGGVEGVTYFDPLKVESESLKASIVFTDFQLFNQSVPVGSANKKEFSLSNSINELEKIDLAYNENSVSFEFAALGSTATQGLKYMHRMKGLEEDWIISGDRNFVSYPKIPSGNYSFQVKAMDQNGQFLNTEKSIDLSIASPPWQTWWAYLIYLMIIGLGIYSIVYVQTERTKAIAEARENERSIFRKKMSRDFHDEAGNKITMISLLTDHATRNTEDTQVVSILGQMQDNIQELRSGMQDFIWVLDPAKDNLFDALIRFRDFANDSFEYTETDFQMDSISSKLEQVEMEGNVRRHFILIFKESITNLLKYSEASKVEFRFKKLGDGWEFNLKDNGKGFNMESLKRVNGLNNMKSRAEKIGSSLDIRSKPGEGTSINLIWK